MAARSRKDSSGCCAQRRRRTEKRGPLRLAASALFGILTLFACTAARADDVLDEARVALHVDVEGPVRVQQRDYDTSCIGPCTLRVPRGYLQVSAPDNTSEIYVANESRLTSTKGAPAVREAGLVTLIAGGVVVVVAVAVPLLFCVAAASDHPSGSSVDQNPCRNASDSLKVAWIAGAGVGLATAAVGATFFALSGPRLHLTDERPQAAARALPVLERATNPRTGATELLPGLALSVSF